MAEEDVALEEVSMDEEGTEGESEEKKGLSKPLLIKIAIGVTVLLVGAGVGAYFFLGSAEEDPELEEIVEQEDVIEQQDAGGEAPKFSDIMKGLPGQEDSDVTNNKDETSKPTRFEQIVEGVQEMKGEASGDDGSPDTMMTNAKPKDLREDNLTLREEMVAIKEQNLRLKQQVNDLGGELEPEMPLLMDDVEEGETSSAMTEEERAAAKLKEDRRLRYFQQDSIGSLLPKEPAPEPMWGDFDRYEYKKKEASTPK